MTVELFKPERRVPTVHPVEEGINQYREATLQDINRVLRRTMQGVPLLTRTSELPSDRRTELDAIARVDNGHQISILYQKILLLRYICQFEGQDKPRRKEVLFGRLGAADFPLALEQVGIGMWEVVARHGFHELKFRDDLGGLLTGELGADTYIVDLSTGEMLSTGHFELFESGGIIYGTTMNRVEPIMRVPQFIARGTI
jgi:hypothetical protein